MTRPRAFQYPVELQLLGALCRAAAFPALGPELDPEVENSFDLRALCSHGVDWGRFARLVTHHRIGALVAKGVALRGAPFPEGLLAQLRAQAAGNVREAFRYLAELKSLLDLLASAKIDPIVLKGVPLSYLAYGDVGLRAVGDIDLLIEPEQASEADSLLRHAGYLRKEPAARLTPRRTRFYLNAFKDFTYEGRSGFEIDLHWRLVRDPVAAEALLPAEGVCSQTLPMGSLAPRVLTREQCLLFLAVHGALEGWARWKTLVDISTLWAQVTTNERSAMMTNAERSGLAPFLGAALRLASDWLGPLPAPAPESEPETSGRGLEDYIVDVSRRQMRANEFMSSPAGESTLAMKLHEARMHPSFRSRIALARRVFFRPRIWESVDLPDALFFLYPLLSPLEWLAFRARRLGMPDKSA